MGAGVSLWVPNEHLFLARVASSNWNQPLALRFVHCAHAVGGIIGFALVWDGTDAVVWAKKDPGSFPPYKGVIAIVLSWFISPVLSGLVAALIFFIVRTLVLRQRNAYALSFWTLPPFVLVTTFINIYFVLTKVRHRA